MGKKPSLKIKFIIPYTKKIYSHTAKAENEEEEYVKMNFKIYAISYGFFLLTQKYRKEIPQPWTSSCSLRDRFI